MVRLAQCLDVWVVEDEGICGDEGHPIDARAGNENAVGRIPMNRFEQRPRLLDDFSGDGQQVPTVNLEEGAKPSFPVAVDLDSPPLLEAGDFADGNGRAPDFRIGFGDLVERGGTEPGGVEAEMQ